MKGTRPLDNQEILLVSACFDGAFEARNRGLFMLGVSTGGRISELLSLQISDDVYQNGAAVTDLLFDKSIVKGGEVSRAVPVNRDGRQAIENLVSWHNEQYGKLDVTRPLFPIAQRTGQQADVQENCPQCFESSVYRRGAQRTPRDTFYAKELRAAALRSHQ